MNDLVSNDCTPVTKAEFTQAMGFVRGEFGGIAEEFRKVHEQFKEVDQRFEHVDRRFDALTAEVRDGRNRFGILHEDMMHQFKLVLECLDPTRAQLEDHERRIRGLEREVPVLKDAVSLRR